MANYKPWLKMWVVWIDDPKMLTLTLEEQAAWWRLCTFAQKCAADGLLIKDSGEGYSIDEILDIIRIKESQRGVFDAMVQKMIKERSLHWQGTILVITNFKKRQSAIPSELPEAVRKRVQRYREKRVTDFPLHEEKESDKEKEDTIQSTEAEAEAEMSPLRNGDSNGDVTGKNPLHPQSVAKMKIPYEQIVELFHVKCPSLPRVKELTEKRKKVIKKVFCNAPETFEELFEKAEASDFLSGRKSSIDSKHSNWRCNFDWLLEDKNRVKVLEGNYDNPAEGGDYGKDKRSDLTTELSASLDRYRGRK